MSTDSTACLSVASEKLEHSEENNETFMKSDYFTDISHNSQSKLVTLFN